MGAGPAICRSDSGRGTVRLRRVVGGRFSQRDLLAGNPSQCAPVSATMRRLPNRLLTLDADGNDSGQQAARCLSRSLGEQGITAHLVSLPEGHDPNSFFVSGGNADEFQLLLERACL